MKRAMMAMTVLLTVGLLLVSAAAADTGSSPTMDGLTGGDAPWQKAYDAAMLEGRAAYNSGNRDEARKAFVEAIQIDARAPAAYRNLARNYNLDGKYRAATAYYDIYLRLAPDADDADTIRDERRGTMARGGDQTWRRPADQRMALRALERELDDGRALSAGQGGAWRLYQTLLATGYASPELEGLRHRLERKMAVEFEEHFRREDGFLPVLSEQQWGLQRQRLEVLFELVRDGDDYQKVERRLEIVDAVLMLFDGDYDRAADEIAVAIDGDERFLFVGWYRVLALERADRLEEALQVLDRLVQTGVFEGEGLRRVEVVRAQLLKRSGQSDQAASVYRQVLGR